jgi:hypothetical protein
MMKHSGRPADPKGYENLNPLMGDPKGGVGVRAFSDEKEESGKEKG